LSEPSGCLLTRITEEQLASAQALYGRMPRWQLADQVLDNLSSQKKFNRGDCLLKTISINALYSTQVLATLRMADHIHSLFVSDPHSFSVFDFALVEKIAKPQGGKRFEVSFASKFCHFFVSRNFPIFDDAALRALKLHNRNFNGGDGPGKYMNFVEALNQLQKPVCQSARQIDKYLWLRGMHDKWNKEKQKKEKSEREGRKFTSQINAELRLIFESSEQDVKQFVQGLGG
jgi:hypothetical protein